MRSSFLSGCCDCGTPEPRFTVCVTVRNCTDGPVSLMTVGATGPHGPAGGCTTDGTGRCCFQVTGEGEFEVYVVDSYGRRVAQKVTTVAGTSTYEVTLYVGSGNQFYGLRVRYCDGYAAFPGDPGGTPLVAIDVPGFTVNPPSVSYPYIHIIIPPTQDVTFPIKGTITYKECVPSCGPATPVPRILDFEWGTPQVCLEHNPIVVDVTNGWLNFGVTGCGNNPLEGATVTTSAGSCVTDATGCCQIEGPPHQVVGDVTYSARGYQTLTVNYGATHKWGYCESFQSPNENACTPLHPTADPGWALADGFLCGMQCGGGATGIECARPVKRLVYMDVNGTWGMGIPSTSPNGKIFCGLRGGGPIVPLKCTRNNPGNPMAANYWVGFSCVADPENPDLITWQVQINWCVTPCRDLFSTYWDPIWQVNVATPCTQNPSNPCFYSVNIPLTVSKPKCMSPVTLAGTWPDYGTVPWGPGPPTFPATFPSECPAKGPWVLFEPFP